MKTKPLALDILKMHYSVRNLEKTREKKRTQNKEMIPLKESPEMFYILRVALKRRCKDAFFFLGSGGGVGEGLPVALQCKDDFLFFLLLPN